MAELEDVLDNELICPTEPVDEEDTLIVSLMVLSFWRLAFLPRPPSRPVLPDRLLVTFLSNVSLLSNVVLRTRGSYSE